MKQLKSIVLLTAFLFGVYIFIFHPEWMGIILIHKPVFPLGTLISWFVVADFSYFVYSILPSNTQTKWERNLKKIMKVFVFLSFFWGVFSYFLAGNWTWSFHNRIYFLIWLIISALFIFSPLIVLVVIIVRKVVVKSLLK